MISRKGSFDNEDKYCRSFVVLVITLDVWMALGNKAHTPEEGRLSLCSISNK